MARFARAVLIPLPMCHPERSESAQRSNEVEGPLYPPGSSNVSTTENPEIFWDDGISREGSSDYRGPSTARPPLRKVGGAKRKEDASLRMTPKNFSPCA